MSHLVKPAQQIADILTAAGIRATLDPRNLTPPAVIVGPNRATRRTSSRIAVDLEAVLYVTGPANADALTALDGLADKVTAALDLEGYPWTEGQLGTANSPATGENLLVYTLTIPLLTKEL